MASDRAGSGGPKVAGRGGGPATPRRASIRARRASCRWRRSSRTRSPLLRSCLPPPFHPALDPTLDPVGARRRQPGRAPRLDDPPCPRQALQLPRFVKPDRIEARLLRDFLGWRRNRCCGALNSLGPGPWRDGLGRLFPDQGQLGDHRLDLGGERHAGQSRRNRAADREAKRARADHQPAPPAATPVAARAARAPGMRLLSGGARRRRHPLGQPRRNRRRRQLGQQCVERALMPPLLRSAPAPRGFGSAPAARAPAAISSAFTPSPRIDAASAFETPS